MRKKYPHECRTFGELVDNTYKHHGTCAFCKQTTNENVKYSERRYACVPCAEQRRDVVLPRVKRHEKFEAALAAIRAGAKP